MNTARYTIRYRNGMPMKNELTGTMTWKMNVTGITDATGAHIHQGKIGENGDIVVDLMKVSNILIQLKE